MTDKIEQKIALLYKLEEEITKKEFDKDSIIILIKELINLRVFTKDIYTSLKEEQKKELASIIIASSESTNDALLLNFAGTSYSNGLGVAKDYNKAVEYYEKAAAKGYTIAECNLGVMYENGNWVTKDYKKAFEYFKKAAEKGYDRAECNLGVMYENGYGVDQDYKKAFEYFKKAAEKGYDRAECNLGVMYENGYGVDQDYKKAAEKGCEEAKNNLKELYFKKKDYDEALKLAYDCYNRYKVKGEVPSGLKYFISKIIYLAYGYKVKGEVPSELKDFTSKIIYDKNIMKDEKLCHAILKIAADDLCFAFTGNDEEKNEIYSIIDTKKVKDRTVASKLFNAIKEYSFNGKFSDLTNETITDEQVKNFNETMINYCNNIKKEACIFLNKESIAFVLTKSESHLPRDIILAIANEAVTFDPLKDKQDPSKKLWYDRIVKQKLAQNKNEISK